MAGPVIGAEGNPHCWFNTLGESCRPIRTPPPSVHSRPGRGAIFTSEEGTGSEEAGGVWPGRAVAPAGGREGEHLPADEGSQVLARLVGDPDAVALGAHLHADPDVADHGGL